MVKPLQAREPIRDAEMFPIAQSKLKLGYLPDKYLQPENKEFVRAFTWLKNSDVPAPFQALLQKYINWTHTFLADPRDTVFVSHIISSFCTVIPSAIILLYRFSWLHAIFHAIMLVFTIPPFILMLHCVSHKKISKSGIPWADKLIFYVLSPFYGQTWNTFYYHHVKHHHIEDNGPLDLSSTMWYDRDNWFHFLIYYCRFYFLIGIELPTYFLKKGHPQWALNVFAGEYLTFLFYASWFYICENPLSVIFAWLVPLNFSRIGMMTGNWTQHSFLAQDDATNDYKTALTVVETPYNALCFNDGYHTSHHLNPVRHWQDHPEHFVKNVEKYREQKVMVFRGCDYWQLWLGLMTKDYKWMAARYQDLSGEMNMEQKVAYLKARTRRLTPEEIEKNYPK